MFVRLLQNRNLFRLTLVLAVLMLLYLTTSNPDMPKVQHADKWAHLISFFLLTFISERAFPKHFPWFVLPAMLLYGGIIELIQAQLPYRSASWADFFADAVGIFAYTLLVLIIRKLYRQPRSN